MNASFRFRFRGILSFRAMIANRCNQRDIKHKNKYNTAFFYHIWSRLPSSSIGKNVISLYENNLDIRKMFQQDRDFIPVIFSQHWEYFNQRYSLRVLYLSTTRLKSEMQKLYLVSYLKKQHVKALKGRHFLSEIEASEFLVEDLLLTYCSWDKQVTNLETMTCLSVCTCMYQMVC